MAGLKAYNRVVELSGDDSKTCMYAYYKIACIHQRLGQLEEAIEKLSIVRESVGAGHIGVVKKLSDSYLLLAQSRYAFNRNDQHLGWRVWKGS
jgi:hypothetical protein